VATPPVLGGVGVSRSEKPLAATQAVLELETAVQAVLGASVQVDLRAYSSGTVLADLHDGGRSAAVDRISGTWSVAALTGPDREGCNRYHRACESVTEAVTAAAWLLGKTPAPDAEGAGRGAD